MSPNENWRSAVSNPNVNLMAEADKSDASKTDSGNSSASGGTDISPPNDDFGSYNDDSSGPETPVWLLVAKAIVILLVVFGLIWGGRWLWNRYNDDDSADNGDIDTSQGVETPVQVQEPVPVVVDTPSVTDQPAVNAIDPAQKTTPQTGGLIPESPAAQLTAVLAVSLLAAVGYRMISSARMVRSDQ